MSSVVIISFESKDSSTGQINKTYWTHSNYNGQVHNERQLASDFSLREQLYHGGFTSRLEGNATFTFPSGTTYVGEFKDGEFHGRGILHYANGAKYEAIWEKGIAKDV